MRKVSLAVTVMCLICVLTGCDNSASKEESQQSFSNIESAELSAGTEATEQPDEMQSAAEENSGLLTDQKETEQIQSEQTEGRAVSETQ